MEGGKRRKANGIRSFLAEKYCSRALEGLERECYGTQSRRRGRQAEQEGLGRCRPEQRTAGKGKQQEHAARGEDTQARSVPWRPVTPSDGIYTVSSLHPAVARARRRLHVSAPLRRGRGGKRSSCKQTPVNTSRGRSSRPAMR
jgi:hypothetical protein